MGLFSVLNREQKEALVLLQIGTFLEYFDLMLYIHMAVLLNDIFFPKVDPYTSSLLAAFAFCSTYVLRPFGALLFGWLGDNIGRKSTIVMTTIMMSISCLIMANLPTYAQVGITASWIMMLCRMAQGISSMGEIMGAEIYIAETITRPASYPAVAFVSVSANLGGMVAVGIAALVMSFGLSWRTGFWIGAVIAVIGSIARMRLRETPDFIAMKRQQIIEANKRFGWDDDGEDVANLTDASSQVKSTYKESLEVKTLVAYFLTFCGWPLCFYLVFVYFNATLKGSFEYSSEDIINHNFFLSIISAIIGIFLCLLSYRIHPIKIIKIKGIIAVFLMISLPFLIGIASSALQIFFIQSLILLLSLGSLPADAIFLYHLPIWRRFTCASFLFAAARALMYIITSFGLVYLSSSFGHYGLWFITLPITFSFLYGVRHFEELERKMGMFGPNNNFFKTDLLKKNWLKHEPR